MLYLHHSNRTESLFRALLEVIKTPLEHVFMPETILVQSKGVSHWLSQKIAQEKGIAANLSFPLPATFIWQLFKGQLANVPDTSAYNRESLLWRCMDKLPGLKAEPGFEAVRHYLSGRDTELKTFQLSRRLAELYDQYLVYRPELVNAWEAGEGDDWQARLWRAMREGVAESFWSALVESFRNSIESKGLNQEALPGRISLFALSSLSPGYLDVIAAIVGSVEVHIFLLNPSLNYWGDIQSEADLARMRETWRHKGRADVSELYSVGNPLLASMGKQPRDFIDQLHEYAGHLEYEYFDDPGEANLLSALQGDILNLQSRGTDECPRLQVGHDHSLEIHACHSPMREVQVLHDRLLSLFDNDPDLSPEDVLVMSPDINLMGSYVEAVFGAAPDERQIPFRIADAYDRGKSPLVETFLSWLALPSDRFEAPRVISWLELEAVQRHFGLDDEMLMLIRHWVSGSGIRWGLDAQHKLDLGLPASNENTWHFGLKRLFLGYAMPVSDELFAGNLPFGNVGGREAIALGRLESFIERLDVWRKRLSSPASINSWQDRINDLLDAFLSPDDDEEQYIKVIRDVMDSLAQQAGRVGYEGEVSASVIQDYLTGEISRQMKGGRFFSGGVTFSTMASMRSLPYKVICLLGLNDHDFPSREQPLGFDLIARDPRKGDRSRREDDRYLFLESMLSAREVFYLSYVGRSQQDNAELLPSVLVSELLDYLDQGYTFDEGNARKALVREHPLQAFSDRNYINGSYASEWLQAGTDAGPFVGGPLKLDREPESFIDLQELISFITHPPRFFLEKTLGLHLAEYDETLDDSERFTLDGLEAYKLKTEILESVIDEVDEERLLPLVRARGDLPQGAFAEVVFHEQEVQIRDFSGKVAQKLSAQSDTFEASIELGDSAVSGWYPGLIEGELFRYRPVKELKAKDRLRLWFEHLLLAATSDGVASQYLAIGEVFRLGPVPRDEAVSLLKQAVQYFEAGHASPLPFFPKTSLAYAAAIMKGKPVDDARKQAERAWSGSQYNQFADKDADDVWNQQAFRDAIPLEKEFQDMAEAIILPMLKYQVK